MAKRSPRQTKLFRAVQRIHSGLYRWSNGRFGGSAPMGAKLLLLTTKGRKTGRSRTVPLMYLEKGRELMVVASNAGFDSHPDWYWNLTVSPKATIQIGAVSSTAAIRIAEGEERERLWADLVSRYPNYGTYQTKTDRHIPLVLLAPVYEDTAEGTRQWLRGSSSVT